MFKRDPAKAKKKATSAEAPEGVANKLAVKWLIGYFVALIIFVMVTWLFFRTEIRTIIDFVSIVQLNSWRTINLIIYIAYAIVAAGIAWSSLFTLAIKHIRKPNPRKPYRSLIPKMLYMTVVIQFVILIAFVAMGFVRDGLSLSAIIFHIKRMGVYFFSIVVITGIAMVSLTPQKRS